MTTRTKKNSGTPIVKEKTASSLSMARAKQWTIKQKRRSQSSWFNRAIEDVKRERNSKIWSNRLLLRIMSTSKLMIKTSSSIPLSKISVTNLDLLIMESLHSMLKNWVRAASLSRSLLLNYQMELSTLENGMSQSRLARVKESKSGQMALYMKDFGTMTKQMDKDV